MAGNRNSGGRNAKSAKMRILQGTFRRDRYDGDAPDPPLGDPTPPVALTGDAKAEWARMLERLRKSRVLSSVDDGALYQTVKLFARQEAVERDHQRLRRLGTQLLQEAKRLRGRDLVDAIDRIASLEAILAKQDTRLRQGGIALKMWYVEFGLTPSARTRVRVGPEAKATDPAKQRFLQGLNLA